MIESQFTVNAALTAARADIQRLLAPAAGTLDRVFLFSDTAMSGADAIFDVNINGVSIWDADQTQRPKITSGNSTVDKTSIAASVSEFDVITVDFDGFSSGSHSIGGKLIVIIQFAESGGGPGANVGAFVELGTNQSAGDNATVTVALDTVVDDDGSLFDSTHHAIKLIPSKYHVVTGQITFASNSTGQRHIGIGIEDSDPGNPAQFCGFTVPALSGVVTVLSISVIIPPSWAGSDTRVYLIGIQNSGGSLTIPHTGATSKANYLSVVPINQP